ncbi:hypothetical protein Cni_G22610 [Canna indica]|uniref:Uncharacterized protein n=1 Tax=Canna indica TaxID=4628 RepID=A0AAQ3QMT5_9LILI|nr:hypothetical protein Cni_G22610 [Canna indica]
MRQHGVARWSARAPGVVLLLAGFLSLKAFEKRRNSYVALVLETQSLKNYASQARNNFDAANDKKERKQELEKKLHVLNEKKHNLVQMLKQITSSKRQNRRCHP